MKLMYKGKTNDVYKRDDGNLEFHFKDTATGIISGGKTVFDPGFDNVVGEIPGKGKVSCQFTVYFFELLTKKGIPNHYIRMLGPNVILARPAELLRVSGLHNLEFVCRNSAYGSFLRRYPFVKPCKNLNQLVEITTKGKSDYLINDDVIIELGIMTKEEVKDAKDLTKKIIGIVSGEFKKKGLHLVDGKIELGRVDGKMRLIDDISPDVIRVCKGAKFDKDGNCITKCGGKNILSPDELYDLMLGLKKSSI
jgi:phosphoribosylaminoimidazole-succinocarboxamide synthase